MIDTALIIMKTEKEHPMYYKWASVKDAQKEICGNVTNEELVHIDQYLAFHTLEIIGEILKDKSIDGMNIADVCNRVYRDVNMIAPQYFKARRQNIKATTRITLPQMALIFGAFYTTALLYDPTNDVFNSERFGIYCDTTTAHVPFGNQDQHGLYVTDTRMLAHSLRAVFAVGKRDMEDLLLQIQAYTPRRAINTDRDLVAVNNGIFNFKLKVLMEFNPLMCFTSKASIDFRHGAKDTPIVSDDGYTFTVEEWIKEIAVDHDVAELIWEIIGACLRPMVSWNRTAFFYSTAGNNGKGSICALIRNILGPGAWCSLPISDFSRNFATSVLIDKQAVITDENNVGGYIDKAAEFKAVVTGDVILVDIKNRQPIPYRFNGFMIQCINDLPRTKDKTGSFYRRQLLVPFLKSFTGQERKYIKDDYLQRQEVLEYVLYRVLMMDYYELSTPMACQISLDEYKVVNDPLMDFWVQVKDELIWDRIPLIYLYDLYQAWYKTNYRSADSIPSRRTFKSNLMNIIAMDGDFVWKERVRFVKTMIYPEPLSSRFHLTQWQDAAYSGSDVFSKCVPKVRLTVDRDSCVDRKDPQFGQPLIDVYEDEFLNSAYYQANQDTIGKPIVIK